MIPPPSEAVKQLREYFFAFPFGPGGESRYQSFVVNGWSTLGDGMNKYILVAFAVMGMAFYEISGGSEFEPGNTSLVVFATPKPVVTSPVPQPEIVARADTSTTDLTDIAPARAVTDPVVATAEAVITQAKAGTSIQAAPVVQEPVVNVEPEPETQPDFRFVDGDRGDRVNLRGGPGTDYAVVGKLFRNDMVEVIKDEGNGWLHLRARATGDEGWMADWLVTAAN